MKTSKIAAARGCLGALMLVLPLVWPATALATAPRIAPQLFGEERITDIVGYRLAPDSEAESAESGLAVALVTAAFAAAGQAPVIDVLPSRQLARYVLEQNEAAALIGGPGDPGVAETAADRRVVFYLRETGEPLSLIFSKTHPRAGKLFDAFRDGLRRIVASGRYRELLEQHGRAPGAAADAVVRLQRLDPGWP